MSNRWRPWNAIPEDNRDQPPNQSSGSTHSGDPAAHDDPSKSVKRAYPPKRQFLEEVAIRFSLVPEMIIGRSRRARVCEARRELACRLYYEANMSYGDIGAFLGGRTASTIHSIIARADWRPDSQAD